MKKLFLFAIVFFTTVFVYAQNDSSRAAKGNKPIIVFSFDGRFSFVKYDAVNISGLKVGVDFNNKWRVGLGIYGLLKPANYYAVAKLRLNNMDSLAPYKSVVKLWYCAVYAEYVIAHKKRWEISVPIQFGIGKTQIDAISSRDASLNIKQQINERDISKTIYLIEPSITGYYKIFNWVGVGTGIGYRQLIDPNKRLNEIFDNPIFIIKAKFFLSGFLDVIGGRKPALKYVEDRY